MPTSRRNLLKSLAGGLASATAALAQPPTSHPGSTTFGPYGPPTASAPCPPAETKHPVPSRTEMALKAQGCASNIHGDILDFLGQIILANCRPYTAADMPKSIQQRCTFCSCPFVIDTTD